MRQPPAARRSCLNSLWCVHQRTRIKDVSLTACFTVQVQLLRRHPKAMAVYLAPTKALCQEKLAEWQAMFRRCGVKVKEASG